MTYQATRPRTGYPRKSQAISLVGNRLPTRALYSVGSGRSCEQVRWSQPNAIRERERHCWAGVLANSRIAVPRKLPR